MKFLLTLSLLFSAFFLGACATTERDAPSEEEAVAEEAPSSGSGLLMDRYKSGEIPGYHE